MKSRVVLAGCGAAVVLAIGCTTTPRDFDQPSEGDGGEPGSSSSGGAKTGGSGSAQAGASSAGGAGAAAGTSGAGGSGTSGSGAGVTGGASGGGGNEAGAGGEDSDPGCPKNSCCLASGTVERDTVEPGNACQSCQPHRSVVDWSDRNGELCHTATAEVFSPMEVAHQSRVCGEGGCSDPYFVEPDAEQMLVLTPTTDLDRLHLDFSNLRGSASLGLTKAVLRFSVKAVAATQPVKVIVSGVAQPVCSYPISQKTYSNITCDVTSAVKAWMQAPASTERSVAIATQNVGNPLMVQSHKAEDAAVRPVLLLDYSASCEGDQCVGIERDEVLSRRGGLAL